MRFSNLRICHSCYLFLRRTSISEGVHRRVIFICNVTALCKNAPETPALSVVSELHKVRCKRTKKNFLARKFSAAHSLGSDKFGGVIKIVLDEIEMEARAVSKYKSRFGNMSQNKD